MYPSLKVCQQTPRPRPGLVISRCWTTPPCGGQATSNNCKGTSMVSNFGEERSLIANACRVLANRGLADGILGHVSLRIDDESLLVRCRGPRERGLGFTEPEDIRLIRFDGTAAAPGE